MKLYQVRKGQFVYYNNELHKVYGIKPMYKLSVHLIKLRDLTQQITKAASVEKYIPRENDSFIFDHKVYTLRNNQRPVAGDYILINNPAPDTLDHYSLNEIEVVETVDNKWVITSDLDGIKHTEYLLMVPGRAPDSHLIDYKDMVNVEENFDDAGPRIVHPYGELSTQLGDIYKKKDSDVLIEAMVVAIYYITVADTATFVLGMLSEGGTFNPSNKIKMTWGVIQSALAAVLLLAGGLDVLQTASIAAALPFAIIMLAMCYSLLTGLKNESETQRSHKRST